MIFSGTTNLSWTLAMKLSMSLTLYKDCTDHSRRCQGCMWLNSQNNIQKLNKLEAIRNCITVLNDGDWQYIQASYPFLGDVDTLYSADKSNHKASVATTRTLFRRLYKVGRVTEFDAEIQKALMLKTCISYPLRKIKTYWDRLIVYPSSIIMRKNLIWSSSIKISGFIDFLLWLTWAGVIEKCVPASGAVSFASWSTPGTS